MPKAKTPKMPKIPAAKTTLMTVLSPLRRRLPLTASSRLSPAVTSIPPASRCETRNRIAPSSLTTTTASLSAACSSTPGRSTSASSTKTRTAHASRSRISTTSTGSPTRFVTRLGASWRKTETIDRLEPHRQQRLPQTNEVSRQSTSWWKPRETSFRFHLHLNSCAASELRNSCNLSV